MTKKKTTNEYSGFDDFKAETQTAAKQDYIAWDKKTNAQRLDSISNYQASILNKVVGEANKINDRSNIFWEKAMSVADLDKSMPFNGETGLPYTSLSGVLMRSIMAIEGFEEPIFLTIQQANRMNGVLKKTGELTRNGKEAYVLGVKVAQLKEQEFVPELNKDGSKKMIPALNKNGKPVLNGKGEQVFKIAGEWKKLKEPMYESVTLYNIAQFDNLDRSKLKSINLDALQKKRESIAKNPEQKLNYKLGMLRGKTGSTTLENLYKFIEATQTGKDFAPKEKVKVNMGATKEFVNDKQQQQGFSR